MIILLILSLLFFPEEKISIKDAWMRPASEKMTTALYFTIENKTGTADTLYKIVSGISERIEMHETYSEGDMSGMRKVEMIVIEGKSSFELKPGSHHVMIMKLKANISDRDTEEFILHFKQAGEIRITVKAKK